MIKKTFSVRRILRIPLIPNKGVFLRCLKTGVRSFPKNSGGFGQRPGSVFIGNKVPTPLTPGLSSVPTGTLYPVQTPSLSEPRTSGKREGRRESTLDPPLLEVSEKDSGTIRMSLSTPVLLYYPLRSPRVPCHVSVHPVLSLQRSPSSDTGSRQSPLKDPLRPRKTRT